MHVSDGFLLSYTCLHYCLLGFQKMPKINLSKVITSIIFTLELDNKYKHFPGVGK